MHGQQGRPGCCGGILAAMAGIVLHQGELSFVDTIENVEPIWLADAEQVLSQHAGMNHTERFRCLTLVALPITYA